ncbi:TPA: hypothetical protein DCZ36_00065 [Candidatus Gracilibacteria bacterium]|nr:hypothetical protein [Candidatus Gracilibacteria bacterium]
MPDKNLTDWVDKTTKLARSNEAQFLCFNVGECAPLFAINVFKVLEVVTRGKHKIEHVVNCHPYVEGMINHRAGIIPVVNIARWLGEDAGGDNKLVVCEFNKIPVAFLTSREAIIERRNWNEIYESSYLKETGKIVGLIKRQKDEETTLIYILDVEALLDEVFPANSKASQAAVDVNFRIINNKYILVAEDSPVARKHIRSGLESVGISNFTIFNNGQELLDYLEKADIDNIGLIITDLEMPETSGFVVTKKVKEDSRTRHIPILIHSSMSGENNIREAMDLGADGFIAKTNIPEFVKQVDKFVLRNTGNNRGKRRKQCPYRLFQVIGAFSFKIYIRKNGL